MPAASLDLTGKWRFKEFPSAVRRMRDLQGDDWLDADIPSSVYTNLIDAGRIDRSSIDADPEDFAWVSEKPWVYRKTFDVPDSMLECDRIDLVFEGLDTIASIWLNDKLLARTDNMFVPHRFEVTALLHSGPNSLMVKFDPAVPHARKLMDRYTTFTESDFNNPYRVYIRKAQYQFGWDFSPTLPGCGIWRPVWLRAFDSARLADVHVRTIECNSRYADVRIAVRTESLKQSNCTCKLHLTGPDYEHSCKFEFAPDHDFHSTVLRIEKPELWWPAGCGPQNLYDLDVRLFDNNRCVDSLNKRVGIRTIKLDRSAPRLRRRHNRRFRFIVNNQPVYIKGANWVPASVFAGSVNEKDYRCLLGAARNANFNMLRVWGGGYYESDAFYEICSELGIMVWQDFMFACGYYPDRNWFMTRIETEAKTIIKRLRSRPCLAVWCGNNEIDWLHSAGLLGKGRKFHGKDIYHKLLPSLVARLDPDTAYIPTTPLGRETLATDPDALDSQNTRIADDRRRNGKPSAPLAAHRWDVWSGHKPVDAYLAEPGRIPPFVTEFGFQSLPDLDTLRTFCKHEPVFASDRSIEKHNYQIHGPARLYRYTFELFAPTADPRRLVYLSQLTQARAVKTYVEFLRANRGANNGVMFWQFNEPAPAISWSAVDHRKHPKALYYYGRRFYAPVLVTALPRVEPDLVSMPTLHPTAAVAVNDSPEPVTGTLNCTLLNLTGDEMDRISLPLSMQPFSTSSTVKLSRDFHAPADPTQCALHLLLENNGRTIAENLLLYAPDKHVPLPKPRIQTQVKRISQETWQVRLSSDVIVKDLHISTDRPASLSDNYLDIIPSRPRTLEIACEADQVNKPPKLQLTCTASHLER